MKEIRLFMKINEIFYSIQGEGFHAGTPAIFIRFSGCNLKCSWCDTEHEIYTEMTHIEIMKELNKYDCHHVILTGGEPMLQVTEEFINLLSFNNYYVHIESNGTIPIPDLINWITISPKKNWVIKKGNELKVIYMDQDLDRYLHSNFDHYYLQPLSGENIQETIKRIKQEGGEWKLSIQLHKILNIR